jgi:hypothetical protein
LILAIDGTASRNKCWNIAQMRWLDSKPVAVSVPSTVRQGKKPMRFNSFLTVLGIAAVAFVGLVGHSASATVRITDDYGGQIGSYLNRYQAVRASGEKVVIDGPCMSACTLVLGVVPSDHICVTPRARLGFHAAWRGSAKVGGPKVKADDGTQLLMETYPQQIRDWIGRHGGLTTQVIYLSGRELAGMYQRCQ